MRRSDVGRDDARGDDVRGDDVTVGRFEERSGGPEHLERFTGSVERWVNARPGRVAVMLAGVGPREVYRLSWGPGGAAGDDVRGSTADSGASDFSAFPSGASPSDTSLFERRFSVASVTKPLVAMALLKLIEWGECRLDDPARLFWPEFGGGGKERVTLRHLVTHTSGLPRALPENEALRRAHASLDEFARRLAAVELAAEPGQRVRYSSPALLAVQKVVEAITGEPLPKFLREQVLLRLGARWASLGLDEPSADDVVPVLLTPDQEATDYHWNSPYYKRLAAPWAGLYARADDLAAILKAILGGLVGEGGVGCCEGGSRKRAEGESGDSGVGRRPFSPAALRAMLKDHTSEIVKEQGASGVESWGLGWRLNRGPGAGELFGDFLAEGAFGHMGATGVSCGADPENGLWWVLLSNDPAAGDWLGRAVNAIAAAVSPPSA